MCLEIGKAQVCILKRASLHIDEAIVKQNKVT